MTAKEFVEQKCYGLEEFDEGGYLGINENRLEQLLEEYHQIKLKLLQHNVSGKQPDEQTIRAAAAKWADDLKEVHRDIEDRNCSLLNFEAGAKWVLSQVAGAESAMDTVAERGTCEYECTGPWDCQCEDVLKEYYSGAGKSSEEQP